jgi:hypothetical protein
MRIFWEVIMFNDYKKIKTMLENMDTKLNHIEDIAADNRALIVKLIKQGNQIVNFLKELEADVDGEYGMTEPPTFDSFIETQNNPNISINVQELIDAYIEKNKSLKEFEEEMKKHKDKVTPGQIGES